MSHDQNIAQQEQALGGQHVSVLTEEVVELLAPKGGELVLDATAGEGGHSERLLQASAVRLVALDADPLAVARVQERLRHYGDRARVLEANFSDIEKVSAHINEQYFDKVLFDLGWNLGQLSSGRGFSFLHDEPLLMSYGREPSSGFTAAQVLNTWSEEALANAFFGYGEERYARRIAKAVVLARETEPFATTSQLVEVIRKAVPTAYARGRIHPATRTFQALRIAVNSELQVLEQGLRAAWKKLRPGGRIVVITFHSIEDRVVKHLFRELAQGGGEVLTKKPILPSEGETRENPSARSAKLRGIEKSK